jgi:hypothetical protein
MDLFQLEESCWATLEANKIHVKCVFSVESIKVMGSWYVMWLFLTHRYQHLGGTWPSSELGENNRTLKRGAEGSCILFGSIYQTSWCHIP